MVHIIEDERIYVYPALRFARDDKTELPGFDKNEYTRFFNANNRSIESILKEYEAVRNATIALQEGFDETALLRAGIANNHKVTVRHWGIILPDMNCILSI